MTKQEFDIGMRRGEVVVRCKTREQDTHVRNYCVLNIGLDDTEYGYDPWYELVGYSDFFETMNRWHKTERLEIDYSEFVLCINEIEEADVNGLEGVL